MADFCPKCNYKLKLTDWRPECPKCGVNVMYYGIEDRLREEADKAEYQHAKSQPKFDRLKFSLIGHPLSIVRLVLGLLPIVATLLPMGTVNYVLPYLEKHASVNLISIVMFIIDNGCIRLISRCPSLPFNILNFNGIVAQPFSKGSLFPSSMVFLITFSASSNT